MSMCKQLMEIRRDDRNKIYKKRSNCIIQDEVWKKTIFSTAFTIPDNY